MSLGMIVYLSYAFLPPAPSFQSGLMLRLFITITGEALLLPAVVSPCGVVISELFGVFSSRLPSPPPPPSPDFYLLSMPCTSSFFLFANAFLSTIPWLYISTRPFSVGLAHSEVQPCLLCFLPRNAATLPSVF